MSKRLQVLINTRDYQSWQNVSKKLGLSLGEWVRQVLNEKTNEFSLRNPNTKIESIRLFSSKNYPSGKIDQILNEIEKGYLIK